MNQKTIMYAAYTFIAFALLSKFSGGAAMAKKAPVKKAAPAPQPQKKKSNFFSKALGFGRKLIGFDADGNPVYEGVSADEVSVI